MNSSHSSQLRPKVHTGPKPSRAPVRVGCSYGGPSNTLLVCTAKPATARRAEQPSLLFTRTGSLASPLYAALHSSLPPPAGLTDILSDH
jgi:hypothetical protein